MKHKIGKLDINDNRYVEEVELVEGAIIKYNNEICGSVQLVDNSLQIFWEDDFNTELNSDHYTIKLLENDCLLLMNGFNNKKIKPVEFFDITLHFTIKTQTIEEIKEKFLLWLETTSIINPKCKNIKSVVLHNCFLTRQIIEEKGFSTDVLDFVESIADETVVWFTSMQDIEKRRMLMLQNLQRLDGLAIFIGDIVEGVATEYDIVNKLGIANIHIE